MSKKIQLYPSPKLSGADRIIGDPACYGAIDSRQPAECVDGRTRVNRDPRLLVMRGPGGGLAFFYVRAALQTVKNLRAIESGTKHATTVYDVLDNSARDRKSPVPQPASFHTGTCRRSAHGLQVDGRIASPDSHTRDELTELAEAYAPRIRVPASYLLDAFDLISTAGKHQVNRLEDRGVPPQKRLAAQVDRATPGVDSISNIEEEPTAHNYLIIHHPRLTLDASTVSEHQTYVDTPGAMVAEVQRTWGLGADELVVATAALLKNTLATRDTLTVAHSAGYGTTGMVNYEAYEGTNHGLVVVRHEIVVPDGLNV